MIRKLFVIILTLSTLITLFACNENKCTESSSNHEEPMGYSAWPMFRHDAQCTGRSPYSGPEIPELKWQKGISGGRNWCPVIDPDGTIYVPSEGSSSPVCGFNFGIHTFDPDGSLKCRTDHLPWMSTYISVAPNGTLYGGTFDGEEWGIHAFDPNCSTKWRFQTETNFDSYWGEPYPIAPIIGGDGTTYIVSANNYLYAINPDSSLKWLHHERGDVMYGPVAIGADGTIYAGGRNLFAFNPDGSLKWSSNVLTRAPNPAIGPDGGIYVSSVYDDSLYAFNSDGSLEWVWNTGTKTCSNTYYFTFPSPAIGVDGTIYVAFCDNYLYAITPSGSLKWRYEMGNKIGSSPVIDASGTIYIGCEDNYLYAIDCEGSLKWRCEAGERMSPLAIGSNGTIYFTAYKSGEVNSGCSYLYAIGENID